MKIEQGWFSFRVVGINSVGEMQSWNSEVKFAVDDDQLREHRVTYLAKLSAAGNTALRVTHTVPEEDPQEWQHYYYLD